MQALRLLLPSAEMEDAKGPIAWASVPATKRLRVVRFDAANHGRSATVAAGVSYEENADAMLAVTEHALGPGRYVFGGCSLGSATALQLAVSQPERVRGLVLMLPPIAWGEERRSAQRRFEAIAKRLEIAASDPAAVDTRAVLTRSLAEPLQPPSLRPMASLDATVVAQRLAVASTAVSRGLERIAAAYQGAARSDLPALADIAAQLRGTPALILAWPGDVAHPLATAERLADALGPSARLIVAKSACEIEAWPERIADFVVAAYAQEAARPN